MYERDRERARAERLEAAGEQGKRPFARPEIREHGELPAVTGYFGLFQATPCDPFENPNCP